MEEAFVLFVRKNALQVLIPKYGLEGTVFMDKHTDSAVTFNQEVKCYFLSRIFLLGTCSDKYADSARGFSCFLGTITESW